VGVPVQKTRLYGYVDPDDVATIENSDYSKSGFVREAVLEKIDREGLADE
jgi:hypothetical protein